MSESCSWSIFITAKEPTIKSIASLTNRIKSMELIDIIVNFNTIVKMIKRVLRNVNTSKESEYLILTQFFQTLSRRLSSMTHYIPMLLPEYLPFKNFITKNNFIINQQKEIIPGDLNSDFDKEMIKIIEHCRKRISTPLKINCDKKQMYLIQNKVKKYYENRKFKQEYSDKKRKLKIQAINRNLIKSQYFNQHCLGCCEEFYSRMTSMFNPYVSFYQVEVIKIEECHLIKNEDNKILASICSFLNEPSGGIILIGCEKWGASIRAVGMTMTEKEKDSTLQMIEGYFVKFYPKIISNKDIRITFVPVLTYDEEAMRDEHINALYVIRIAVSPTYISRIYSYKVGDRYFTQVRSEGKSMTLNLSDLTSFMLKKYNKWRKYDRNSRHLRCHYGTFCVDPSRGNYITNDEQIRNSFQIQQKTSYFQNEQNDQKKYNEYNEYNEQEQKKQVSQPYKYIPVQVPVKQQYKFCSLLVADAMAKAKYEEHLQKDPKIVQFKIQKPSYGQNFKMIKHTWLLHHDDKYETMKKVIERHQLKYNKNKPVYLIATNKYLQIVGGLNESCYVEVYQSVYLMTATQINGLVEMTNSQNLYCWVFQFEAVEGAIFAYFYLSSMNLKVKFIRGSRYFNKEEE